MGDVEDTKSLQVRSEGIPRYLPGSSLRDSLHIMTRNIDGSSLPAYPKELKSNPGVNMLRDYSVPNLADIGTGDLSTADIPLGIHHLCETIHGPFETLSSTRDQSVWCIPSTIQTSTSMNKPRRLICLASELTGPHAFDPTPALMA